MSGTSGTGGHLDIGGVFEQTGEIYQKAFGTFWLVALLLLVPAAIIQFILGDGWLGSFLGRLVQLVAGAWLMGSVIRIVQDVETSGEVDYTIGDLLGSVGPRILAIIVLEIIVGILVRPIGRHLFLAGASGACPRRVAVADVVGTLAYVVAVVLVGHALAIG